MHTYPAISVEEYDQREQEAADALPCRVVEMVNPVTFASEGYPVRIRHERALWRYINAMHEARFDADFASLYGGKLTAQESEWMKAVARSVCEFSRPAFGRPLTARSSLLRSLHIFRSIVDIVGSTPLKAFEIGPGSGLLGAFFIQNGWGYGATDIAQAFYLIQNRFWTYISQSQVVELASEQATWDGQLSAGRPVHVPWWEFFRLIDRAPSNVDVVTCNHALAEMHPNSLAFTLRLAHKMLQGEGLRLFVFEGWGFEKLNARSKIIEQFHNAGFILIHSDDAVTVFAPQSALATPQSRILPPGPIRSYVQKGSSTHLPGNLLTEHILKARLDRQSHLKVTLDEVNRFYRDLVGTDDLATADERFLAMIGKGY